MQGVDGRWSSKAPHGKKRAENDSLNITSGWEEPVERGKLDMQNGQAKHPPGRATHRGCGAVAT